MSLSQHFFRSVATVASLGAVLFLSSASMAQNAASGAISAEQKKAFEGIVREYILENPEIITEAIDRLREKQRLTEVQADKAILASSKENLFNDPDAPVGGNRKGDVTIVEFFDYRCGVCKRIHPIVDELVKTDPNIRRVYKEWPILGPNSVLAARAAIASRKQGKYLDFHKVMMEANSSFELDAIPRHRRHAVTRGSRSSVAPRHRGRGQSSEKVNRTRRSAAPPIQAASRAVRCRTHPVSCTRQICPSAWDTAPDRTRSAGR